MTRQGIVLALFILACAPLFGQRIHLYVSPRGNDSWSGKLGSPNRLGTDGPLATFPAARDALRKLRGGNSGGRGATIHVRGGSYALSGSLTLTEADSGTRQAPVIWENFNKETVDLTGGRPLRGFAPVTDASILDRLQPAARPHVRVANLRAQGISRYGDIVPRGGPPMELFFKKKRMTVARYPNEGWLLIEDVPQTGDTMFNKGLEREKRYFGVPAGRHYGRIAYADPRPARWKFAGDVFMQGYWTFDWSDSYQRVQSFDTARKEITIAPPHHGYGYTKNQRYYYLNVLEELDAPGEWYLDRSGGQLYFWPPADIDDGDAWVSLLEDPLIAVEGSAWIRVEGMRLQCSRGRGIAVTGGHDIRISGCDFRNLGKEAVTIEGGRSSSVIGSEITETGLGGIVLRGGDRRALVPGLHAAANNHIHHYSRWLRTGQYAVFIDGVGLRMSNNLMHDAPFEGVYIRGNDNTIERNEFHHLMQETGDAGAIHTGRDWTWRGNVIRENYFHDLKGPGLHGVMAVYLDDWASGFLVEGNLFYRAGRATLIGGGRDNTVRNNIYVECSPSVHVDARGLGWASYYFDGTLKELFTKMDDMRFKEPPYSVRYPALLTMYDGETPVPKHNRIVGNVSYGGRWMDVYDYLVFDLSVVTIRDNVIGDPVLLRRRADGGKGWDPYYIDIDMKEGYVSLPFGDSTAIRAFPHNFFRAGNPGIVAPEKGDFRFARGSAVERYGIRGVSGKSIGLTERKR
jgi:hypothetical protein